MNYYIPNNMYSNNVINNQNDFNLNNLIFMENILNKTKKIKAKIYTTFTNSEEYRDKIFEGIIEFSGKDYLMLSDPKNGHWNLIPNIAINYIEFEEDIIDNINKKD